MAKWLAPSAGVVGVGWAMVTAVPHSTLGPALLVSVSAGLPLLLAIALITGLALVAVFSPDQIRRTAATEILDRLLSALARRPPRP